MEESTDNIHWIRTQLVGALYEGHQKPCVNCACSAMQHRQWFDDICAHAGEYRVHLGHLFF